MAERSVFVDAGRRGAARRWGERRVIDLRTIDPAVAGVIRAILRAEENNKAVAVSDDASDGPAEVTHAGVDSES